MKRRFLPILLLGILSGILIFSCKKSSNSGPSDMSVSYFPLQMGRYVVYNVDSIYWVDTSCLEYNTHYQLRYQVEDTFTDANLNVQYVIYEFKKSDATNQQWVSNDVFYATVNDTGLVMTKDELRYIKFELPIKDSNSWEGNVNIHTLDPALSYFDGWHYTYKDMGKPYYNGTLSFDNTVTVAEADQTYGNIDASPDSTANHTFFKEIYANGVGLIYGEYTHWSYDPQVASCRKGYSVKMYAIDHN